MAIVICSRDEMWTEESDPVWKYPDYVVIKEQYCHDPDDDTFITIGLGGGTEITKAQLTTRALDIHTRYPFNNISGDEYPYTLTAKTTGEVEAMINDWCTSKNVG